MASTPDLSAVGDTAEFIQALRLLKIWAGNPSFDQLARRSGVPRSTLADVVKRGRKQLPALDVVRAYVQAQHFPDGQLYVNLRGYDPGEPVEPSEAAGMLLRSLVPDGATIPSDEHARVSLLRSLTVDRRLLVLLDNASSPDQVRPLLT